MNLEIFLVDTISYPIHWSWLPHRHTSCYQMYYFAEGSGECAFVIGSSTYYAKKGDIAICKPNELHALLDASAPMEKVYEFQFNFVNPVLAEALDRVPAVLPAGEIAKRLMPVVAEFRPSRDKNIKSLATGALQTVLLDLSAEQIDRSPAALNAALIDMSGYKRITTGVISYIDKNYQNPIMLDDIAKALDCNKSYMCTLFKNDCGITINDYLNSVRIHKAAEYLTYTDKEISYICSLVGFRNVSHFNRTFKQYQSVPPSWFKRFSPVNINYDRVENDQSQLSGKIKEVEDRVGGLRNSLWFTE